jgi:hypothetical protein
MGHSIHHQSLPLDEELVHAEHERDRELGRARLGAAPPAGGERSETGPA